MRCRRGDTDRRAPDMTFGYGVVFRIRASPLPSSQAFITSAAPKAPSRVILRTPTIHPSSWEFRTFWKPGVPHLMGGLAKLGGCSVPYLVMMPLLGSWT